jgi:succinate dehydrogenase/fumarate reductase cytochrome b subunit
VTGIDLTTDENTMPRHLHRIAGLLAMFCIATFLTATVLTELFGSPDAVAGLKSLIVTPGLWILIPALAATGGSGMFLGRTRRGRLVDAKKQRMPFIAANGLMVLLPCALVLDRWAGAGAFDARFYAVQALELLAGAVNLTLMGLNVRDGLRLAGRLRAPRRAAQAS